VFVLAHQAKKSPEGKQKHSKNFVFGPRTLVRTWGTRVEPFLKAIFGANVVLETASA
jgi:hypothetical protein